MCTKFMKEVNEAIYKKFELLESEHNSKINK